MNDLTQKPIKAQPGDTLVWQSIVYRDVEGEDGTVRLLQFGVFDRLVVLDVLHDTVQVRSLDGDQSPHWLTRQELDTHARTWHIEPATS